MGNVSILFQKIHTHAEECLQCERYFLHPISESYDRRACAIGGRLMAQLSGVQPDRGAAMAYLVEIRSQENSSAFNTACFLCGDCLKAAGAEADIERVRLLGPVGPADWCFVCERLRCGSES
jgi:hypothetical protein